MEIQDYVEEFNRQGFTVVRGALEEARSDLIREGVVRAFEGPEDGYGGGIRTKMFEKSGDFVHLMDARPVIDVVEALLGRGCHMFMMNALKTPKGQGIDYWHVDEELFFPLPEGVEMDPRITMPTFLVTCIYYLVDVSENMGPTQLIPGSHRSGQEPPQGQDPPLYNGRGPDTIVARKGDCLIFSGQTWHRGSLNQSDNVRYVQQVAYGKRWISQRFYPFINYRMPEEAIAATEGNPRLARLLGLHRRGAYG